MCAVAPFMLLVITPVIVIYILLHQFFRRCSVEMQRLDSSTRSVIQASFYEALVGLDSIRCYRVEDIFMEKTLNAIERNFKIVLTQMTCNRWLGVRLETLAAFVSLGASTITWWLGINPSLAGLCIVVRACET